MRPGSAIRAFLCFLIRPEDTSVPEAFRDNRPSPFDNRLGGAIKICCWIGIAVGFWIVLPLVSSLFAGN